MKLRTVTRLGIFFKQSLFMARELDAYVGCQVLVDDLGVEDTDEILIKTQTGDFICTAMKWRNPYSPMKKGKFERELQRRGIKKPPMRETPAALTPVKGDFNDKGGLY